MSEIAGAFFHPFCDKEQKSPRSNLLIREARGADEAPKLPLYACPRFLPR